MEIMFLEYSVTNGEGGHRHYLVVRYVDFEGTFPFVPCFDVCPNRGGRFGVIPRKDLSLCSIIYRPDSLTEDEKMLALLSSIDRDIRRTYQMKGY